MNNDKKMFAIFMISGVMFLLSLGLIFADWGMREKMIELDNWKATYESGYCPTCGAKMEQTGEKS